MSRPAQEGLWRRRRDSAAAAVKPARCANVSTFTGVCGVVIHISASGTRAVAADGGWTLLCRLAGRTGGPAAKCEPHSRCPLEVGGTAAGGSQCSSAHNFTDWLLV